MVFKVVDNNLTTVFNKVQSVSNGFDLASSNIENFVDGFNRLNSQQNFGSRWESFLDGASSLNSNVSLYFQELAEKGASAKASVEGVYAAILDGNTKGFANVKSTMTLFNQAQQSGTDNAKAFAKAVGQSNTQLGNYLGGLDGAKASLVGYGTQLAITTAKTIGLRAVTMALNAALTWGLSAGISALISWLDTVIVTEKELAEQAKESAEKTQEQIKSLDDLKKKYIEIVDSTDSEKTKNEQLNEIKQELIETYGIEKEHLEDLNLERENGIELLEKEIALKSQEERGNWLGTNKNAFNKAKSKINNINYDKATDGRIHSAVFKRINEEDVRDSVKDLFSNIYDIGAEGNTFFEVAGDTLIEKYENLQKIITKLGNSKNLTRSEQNLLDGLNKESEAIKKILDENQEIYETGYKFTAENYFADYVNNNKVEDVGKETYLAWRNGLLETADGDKVLEQNLLNLAEEQFPDYAEYFNNLNLAKSKFGISDTINSATEGMKLALINSLDNADLDILVNKIEDPFKNGIEGAEKAIADFKADPNNKIAVETDTKSIDDMLQAVEDYSKSANTYVKNQKTVTDALEEQSKYGKLASSTVIELTDAGYASALVYDKETGAITLNKQAVENLNIQKQLELKFNLAKEKSEIEQKYKDEATAVAELQREMATANETRREAIRLEIAEKSKNMAEYYEMMSQYEGLINSIGNYAPSQSSSSSSSDPWKEQFEKEYSEKQHLLTMNQISEEQYINWLDGAYKHYFSDLTKYQDEYNKYEEEVYKYRTDREQKLFDKKIDNLEKLADKALDSYKDGDGNELTVTASFDYARDQINKAITETQARIDGIRNGTISGDTDDIEALIDDLDSLNDKLIDINKKEIESEKDYISELKDDYSDMMDERIDKVDELSDKIEKSYDKQIDAIDKQIDELEKVKDTEDRIKKIKDAQLAVKEKEQALDEAKREDAKNNYVYFDGTGMSVQTSNENQKKAQEELDESKKDLEEAYRDEQISVLKDQKDILEEQKDTAKDYYDNVKDNLEKQKTQGEKTYEAVEKIYEQLGGDKKQTSSNTGLLRRLLFSGNISKAMSELSDTERQKAIDTGVVKVQPNGDYTFDYSAFAKYSSTVDNNTLATQDLTSILKDIVTQADTDKDKTDNSMVAGGFNLVADPKTGKLTKKQVMVNGEVVEGLGHKVYATSKEEWQEHNNSEKTKKGSFAGYDTFFDFMMAVNAGKVDISPLTNAFNSGYNPIVDKMNKSVSDTINNVSNSNVNNVNNKPVVNLTVNVEGSADKKTVEAFRNVVTKEIGTAFDEFGKAVRNAKV
jgi:hypothetical protein